MFKSALFILGLTVFSNGCMAQHNEWLNRVSQDKVWHSLLGLTNHSNVSEIHSDSFFLSEEKNRDSLSELKATLAAFQEGKILSNGSLAQCKFRGRFFYLKDQLNFSELGIQEAACPEFEQWSNHAQAPISVIYASGFFKNPASFYGHILLKIDQQPNISNNLNDHSVNYGAKIPNDENMMAYIAKGLLGGYQGSFSRAPYYKNIQIYAENDLRDLWEYKLHIEPIAHKIILGHIWELMGETFTYYFLDKNCVYRVAELLEMFTPKTLISNNKAWFMPQDFVQNLNTLTSSDPLYIENVHYHPSRQSSFILRFNALSAQQKQLSAHLINDPSLLPGDGFRSQSMADQTQILDFLTDYHQYLKASGKESAHQKRLDKAVLMARFKLPAQRKARVIPSSPPPHHGRRPSRVYAGLAQAGFSEAILGIRPNYYDTLDTSASHPDFSTLKMGELELRASQDGAYVSRFSLIEIESIQKNSSGLPGDRGLSWGLKIGAQPRDNQCRDCLALDSYAAAGYSKALWGRQLVTSVQLQVGYEGRSLTDQVLHISPHVKLFGALSDTITYSIDLEDRRFLNDPAQNQFLSRATLRAALSENIDLRLSTSKDVSTQTSLMLGFYW